MKKITISLLSLVLAIFISSTGFAQPSSDPEVIWATINSGWSGVYSDLNDQHLDPRKNYVVWSLIAPRIPLDLRKPDFFRDFLAHNSSKSLSISHNLVGWKCTLPNGERIMGATGMSGERSGQTAKLVKSGHGLTTFLATFTDGWLSPADTTAHIWEQRSQNEEIYNLAVEVSSQDCANMHGFIKKFVFHPKKPFKKFGLMVDPERFEGAGCVSFASALLKRAGILNKVLQSSERKLWASHYRFGGNDLPLPENTKVPRLSWREGASKRVGINEFFSANWNAGLKGVSLSLLDPELMVWAIKSLSPGLAASPRKVQKFPEDNGLDCRGNPFPECRYRQIKIDNSYDKQAAQVSSLAKSWKRGLQKRGYNLTVSDLRGEPLLIFEQ